MTTVLSFLSERFSRILPRKPLAAEPVWLRLRVNVPHDLLLLNLVSPALASMSVPFSVAVLPPHTQGALDEPSHVDAYYLARALDLPYFAPVGIPSHAHAVEATAILASLASHPDFVASANRILKLFWQTPTKLAALLGPLPAQSVLHAKQQAQKHWISQAGQAAEHADALYQGTAYQGIAGMADLLLHLGLPEAKLTPFLRHAQPIAHTLAPASREPETLHAYLDPDTPAGQLTLHYLGGLHAQFGLPIIVHRSQGDTPPLPPAQQSRLHRAWSDYPSLPGPEHTATPPWPSGAPLPQIQWGKHTLAGVDRLWLLENLILESTSM